MRFRTSKLEAIYKNSVLNVMECNHMMPSKHNEIYYP